MSDDAKSTVSVVRTGREEHVLRLDEDAPKDPWSRESESNLLRLGAERDVRNHARKRAEAKAEGWDGAEIGVRHVLELVREVDFALWSVTVRDLIAEAVMTVRLDLAAPRRGAAPAVLSARPEKLPAMLRPVAETKPWQAEAAAMLRELGAFLSDPPPFVSPLVSLDKGAEREALDSGRKLDAVREDLAGKLGSTGETFTRAVRRAKAAPKKPRR